MAKRSRSPIQAAVWLQEQGPGHPTVLSSRARLTRNIDGLPFPVASGEEDLERARGAVLEAVSRRVADDRDWEITFAEEVDRDRLSVMTEEHMTSPDFAERPEGRAVAARWVEGLSVTANEEDHVRIQALLPGNQMGRALELADGVDTLLEGELTYCFDDRLGYLTSCPSNAGTGLRLSVMMHLPALVVTGDIARTIAALGQAGVFVRGLYGDGSGVAGNLFQISNRRTLGSTEEAIVAHLDRIVLQVMDNERTARKMMLRESPLDVADRVSRALGVIERARKMGFFEALELLSLVKMGEELELLPVRDFNLMEVVVGISPGHMRAAAGQDYAPEEEDEQRAPRLRSLLDI